MLAFDVVGFGARSIGRSVLGVVRIAVTALGEFGVCVCMFGNDNGVVSNELWHSTSVFGMHCLWDVISSLPFVLVNGIRFHVLL